MSEKSDEQNLEKWTRDNKVDLQTKSEEFDGRQRKNNYYTRHRPQTEEKSTQTPKRRRYKVQKNKVQNNEVRKWTKKNEITLRARFKQLDDFMRDYEKGEREKSRTLNAPAVPLPKPKNEQTSYTSIARRGILPPARTLQEADETWLDYRSLTSTSRDHEASGKPSTSEILKLPEPPNHPPYELALELDKRFLQLSISKEKERKMDSFREEVDDFKRDYMEISAQDGIILDRESYRQKRHSFPFKESQRYEKVLMDLKETESHSEHTSVESSDTIGQEVPLDVPGTARNSSAGPRGDIVEAPAPVIQQQPVQEVAPQNQEPQQGTRGGFCCFRRKYNR